MTRGIRAKTDAIKIGQFISDGEYMSAIALMTDPGLSMKEVTESILHTSPNDEDLEHFLEGIDLKSDSNLDDIFRAFDEHRHDIGATKCICDLTWDLSRSNNKDILLAMDRNRHRIPSSCQQSVLKEVDIALGRIDPTSVSGRSRTEHPYDKPYFVREAEASERIRGDELKGISVYAKERLMRNARQQR